MLRGMQGLGSSSVQSVFGGGERLPLDLRVERPVCRRGPEVLGSPDDEEGHLGGYRGKLLGHGIYSLFSRAQNQDFNQECAPGIL
jgi:hypothetical protein